MKRKMHARRLVAAFLRRAKQRNPIVQTHTRQNYAERLRDGQATVERAGGRQPAALRPTQGHAGPRLGNAPVHHDPADYHGWSLEWSAFPQPRPVRAALPSPSSSITESSDGRPAHAAPMRMRIDSMLCRDSCGLEAASFCPHPRNATSVGLAVTQTCD